jgi:hypothetical protein
MYSKGIFQIEPFRIKLSDKPQPAEPVLAYGAHGLELHNTTVGILMY